MNVITGSNLRRASRQRFLDCKTVRIFAYSSTREQSNKRSGTRLKTESENTVGITNRLFGYFTANDMRLTTRRQVPYAQSELRGVACVASVSARVRRERRDESKRRGTPCTFFFRSRSNFCAMTRLETLATQAIRGGKKPNSLQTVRKTICCIFMCFF